MDRMKNGKYNALATAVALMLGLTVVGACGSDDHEARMSAGVPLRVSSTLEEQRALTRFSGDGSGTQATEILPGQTVWIWANYANGANYLPAWKLTAGSAGQLSGVVTTTLSGSLRYYPVENEPINLYGVQGNLTETIVEASTELLPTLTHTVQTAQTTNASYATSDLLWGYIGNQQYHEENGEVIAETIVIPFKHCLSKVEVTLALADGETVYTTDDLRAARVELMHVKPSVTLTMADGSISEASGSETALTVKTANSVAGYSGDWLEAIVPPQTFAANKAFLCVTMSANGAERPLYFVPSADLVLAANHRYRFSFVVSSQAITLGSVTYEDFETTTTPISPVPVP